MPSESIAKQYEMAEDGIWTTGLFYHALQEGKTLDDCANEITYVIFEDASIASFDSNNNVKEVDFPIFLYK